MKIVLLGAPGAGKGTQAVKIAEKYGIPHISTGDIFRQNIKERTPIGIVAKGYIDGGNLVPDEVTVEIVRQRLCEKDCEKGYILDGFPRTVEQAEALGKMGGVDFVLDIVVPEEKLMARLTGRRVCAACGESYHVSQLGGGEICARCGGKLICREDDNEQTVRERLNVYHSQTQPLVRYYEEKGLLVSIDGDSDKDRIFQEISEVLSRHDND